MKVVALAGGTGSAKLLRGLAELKVDLTVVANVGDNAWIYGVYVCPDIDIACYSLAGVAGRKHGWGIEGDTFVTLESLRRLGADAWFALGDRDLVTCLARTGAIRSGKSLTEATESERRMLGLACRVLPATDDPLETRIVTPKGELGLQEFWVRDRGAPKVNGVRYRGARSARPTEEVASAIGAADRIVICPANPITSIGPSLAIPGFALLLEDSRARVTAVSPMIGRAPFSGPAAKMLRAVGWRQDSVGVAESYSRFIDCMLISRTDAELWSRISRTGVKCIVTDTRMDSREDEVRLAREALEA